MSGIRVIPQDRHWLSVDVLPSFRSSPGRPLFLSVYGGEIRQTFSLGHGQ